VWIGWPGRAAWGGHREPELDQRLVERRLVPIPLAPREVREYYDGFSNGVLWPLFHYLLERVPLDGHGWDTYRAVNLRFADAIANQYRPGDTIWIHDYQLLLVPGLLRRRIPDSQIGFFLHIPFPSSELFRALPWRRDLLEGVLGADLIGFHTHGYVRHFIAALRHVLGLEPAADHVSFAGRQVRFGSFPMGIDAEAFATLAGADAVIRRRDAIKQESGGRKLLFGIDRLDYTKGIPRRLLAFERLLESDATLPGRLRLVQVAVPSRADAEPYQAFRRQVEEIVGRINGRFGTLGDVPVHYLYRRFDRAELTAMYLAADVMVVTPVRDGMNLVAKEFVASRIDDDGVLVLSEFAGAAAELGEALPANPYDIDGTAGVLRRALDMDREERRSRVHAMRERVRRQTVHRWTETFLAALIAESATAARGQPPTMSAGGIRALGVRLRAEPRLTLLLDYDGTLAPFAPAPELARPDQALLDLLDALTRTPHIIHIVSGRRREAVHQWLGHLPVDLWAEHGLWHRNGSGGDWRCDDDTPTAWMPVAADILARFTARTPGSLVEQKTRSLAWHYRMSDPELGSDQAVQLRQVLSASLAHEPVDILDGHKVIEIRPRGVDKGRVVRHVLAGHAAPPLVVAVGDDVTDEDMFAALAPSGVSVRVGSGSSGATHRVADWRDARLLLGALAG
jgi:trehalose 6-phosphate synthase/phosphatase